MIIAGPRLAELRDQLVIRPDSIDYTKVEPSSIDFHWTDELKYYTGDVIDSFEANEVATIKIPTEGYILSPNKIYLFTTAERLVLPKNMVSTCEGRSSIGRLGMQIHSTAGYIDPGWEGQITLEVSVVEPVRVYPWMRVGQFVFHECDETEGYDGRYQYQKGVVESKWHQGEIKK